MEKHDICGWRRLKGLSQTELASRLKVSLNTIRFWEKNSDHIQIRFVPDIANALGVPQDSIIFSSSNATSSSNE